MEENDKKVSVKINKIWWILGILAVIVVVANVYVITNNKTQTNADKNFEAERQANAVSTRIEKVEEEKTSNSTNSTKNEVIEKKEDSQYTYKNVKGTYKATATYKYAENTEIYYTLILHENGMFQYQSDTIAAYGVIGNYIIVEDNIILNNLFRTGSDAGIDATEGQKILKINENSSIIDSKPELSESVSIVLKKTSESTSDGYDISYLISNSYIGNNTNIDREKDNSKNKVEIPDSVYTKVKGIYNGTAKDEYDSDKNREYELYLHENGTFAYVNGVFYEHGVTGNYIIVDDTIYLNYLFATGSDAGLDATEGNKELKINDDGSITDSKPEETSEATLVLKKSSTSIKDDDYDINYMINNFHISNNASDEE